MHNLLPNITGSTTLEANVILWELRSVQDRP